MRKQGPCRHCGVTSTPLWRNGPPEKPVLCNACGSRWRTKGTLKNYTPLHCRGPLEDEHSAPLERAPFKSIEENLCTRKKNAQIIKNKCDNRSSGRVKDSHNGPHDNISNWSSSGSAISFAESCSHFSIADSSEVTGSLRSNIADSLTPSWKRKSETQPRTSSPVEKLTEDLHSILHQHPTYFLESSEEDLLYDNMSLVDYTEIGHGGFLIRNMNSTSREPGSTSSSFPDLGSKTIHTDSIYTEDIWSDGADTGMDNNIKTVKLAQEYPERDLCQEEYQILCRDSVLRSINLKDVINYDIFTTHLTSQEQERLMEYLPSTDINRYPESVKMMFSSLQFEETLCNFQELICQGALDYSSYMGNVHDYQTLRRLVLLMRTKCSWVEHYTRIKAAKHKEDSGAVENDHQKDSRISSSCSTSLKRTYSSIAIESPGPKVMERGPRTKWNHYSPSSLSTNSSTHFTVKNQMEFERSGFGPDGFFTSHIEKSYISDPTQPPDENSYENILIDVSSSSSFPEAVLLSTLSEGKSA